MIHKEALDICTDKTISEIPLTNNSLLHGGIVQTKDCHVLTKAEQKEGFNDKMCKNSKREDSEKTC